jgi:hypothetical protein
MVRAKPGRTGAVNPVENAKRPGKAEGCGRTVPGKTASAAATKTPGRGSLACCLLHGWVGQGKGEQNLRLQVAHSTVAPARFKKMEVSIKVIFLPQNNPKNYHYVRHCIKSKKDYH